VRRAYSNAHLNELDNYITSGGIKSLFESIEDNSGLSLLDVIGNDAAELESCIILFRALNTNITLKQVFYYVQTSVRAGLVILIGGKTNLNQEISKALSWPQSHSSLLHHLQQFVLEILCCSPEFPFELLQIITQKSMVVVLQKQKRKSL